MVNLMDEDKQKNLAKLHETRLRAEQGKELFISSPNWQEHSKASELLDCFDFIIENSTVK